MDFLRNLFAKSDYQRQQIMNQRLDNMANKRDINGLIRELKHKDTHVRFGAAFRLMHLRDNRAVRALCELLKEPFSNGSDNPKIAATALGEIRDSSAIPDLLDVLQNTDIRQNMRVEGKKRLPSYDDYQFDNCFDALDTEIVKAIGKMWEPNLAEPLLNILSERLKDIKNEEGNTRRDDVGAMVQVLSIWADVRAAKVMAIALRKTQASNYPAIANYFNSFKELDQQTIDELIIDLIGIGTNSKFRAGIAAKALTNIGKTAIRPLQTVLDKPNIPEEARQRVATILDQLSIKS